MSGYGQIPDYLGLPMGTGGYTGRYGGQAGGYGAGAGYGGRGRDRGRGRGGTRGRGGGGRPSVAETSDNRLRKMVIKLGDDEDFDPIEDPPRLAKVLKRGWREGTLGILEGFRISVTQQPQKHGFYVGLLMALSKSSEPPKQEDSEKRPELSDEKKEDDDGKEKDDKPQAVDDPLHGKEVLDDLNRAFRGWVEGREWQNVRLCLQFFSHLVTVRLATSTSLLNVYETLLNVIDEVGGGGDRAERAVRAVGEGLIRSGSSLAELDVSRLEGLMSKIEVYIIGRRSESKALQNPFAPILPNGQEQEPYLDNPDNLLAALHAFQASNWNAPSILPSYFPEIVPSPSSTVPVPYELQEAMMPPEFYESDMDEVNSGEGQMGTLKLFADDIVPPPSTLEGWYLRSLVLDIVNIYEVNRKEAARILLDLRKYVPRDTFKPSSQPADASPPSSSWSLESLVVSTLLNALLTFPKAHCKLIYYGSVITELCKVSPNTVAPPVGRSMRKIFSMLGSDGLDVEIVRRLSEWFSVHLSNFGFQWMWKEWIPELELPGSHPRRAFMRRVVELEVRLSYWDRIVETLPEAMAVEGTRVISSQPPDPYWAYEKEDHPLHTEATNLLSQIRQKSPGADVIRYIIEMPNASSSPAEPLYPNIRSMAFETILHLGSRSFSHFLNATERYSEVLRFLTPDYESRRLLLEAVKSYWRRSSEMRLITLDKYLQYGILEGIDVVEWVFVEDESVSEGEEGSNGWTDGDKWEVLLMCLEKHVGRVKALQRRLKAIEREDEAVRARRAAERFEKGEDVSDGDDIVEDSRPESSKEARDAQTSLDINTTRLEKVLLSTFKNFVLSLLPWMASEKEDNTTGASSEGLKAVLTLLDNGEEALWNVRAKWGWYREFIRRYQRHLIALSEPINSTILSSLNNTMNDNHAEGRAEKMIKTVWDLVVA
ncbi:uncharacterized protein L203_104234 [Cryptococcus depauperatus CBS 7841]|uniref:Nuclear cap-binding protein subunit 1 n=1 Tax=Cryptococcus depauperatus CBS 7841 TaxID=1295531 RepID=A0AAJ8JV51_9TREE